MPAAEAQPTPVLGPLVRKRRKALGLTLRALCDRAGLSPGYLSQVENDKAVPTLGTLAQVAHALDVGLDYFVTEPRPADALSRTEGRQRFSISGAAVVYEAVSADYPGSELTSYILHVPPGYVSESVSHAGEEIVVILDGEIEQTLGGQVMAMRPGDCLHYSGAVPHAWANRTGTPARLLWTGRLDVLHWDGAPVLPAGAPANTDTAKPPTGETI